jgi:hypothetical protein
VARACSLSGSIVAGHERPHDMFFLNRLKPEFLREANRRRPKVTTLLIEAPSACGRHQLRDLRQTRLEHAKELQAAACDVTEVVAYSRIISNTCIRSSFDVLITFKISAVAVCCSLASFSSLVNSETDRCLWCLAATAMRRLVLTLLWPFVGLTLWAFTLLVLPPVFVSRATSAPG